MSEHTDNPELEDEQMTRVIDTDARGWDDGDEVELPPRPRGRLLRPLPLLLIAVTIAAAGFLGGVLAQKGSESGAPVAGAGGLPSFAAKGAEAAGGEGEVPGGSEAAGEGGAEATAPPPSAPRARRPPGP